MPRLLDFLAATEDYRRMAEHLRYDQQVAMPTAALPDRARQLAELERIIRTRTKSSDMQALLDDPGDTPPDVTARARRDFHREKSLPTEAIVAWTALSARAFEVWRGARATDDWRLFAPVLDELVRANLRIAHETDPDTHPMDVLLSMYAEGPSHHELSGLIATLRDDLVSLHHSRLDTADRPRCAVNLSLSEHLAVATAIGDVLGFDWPRGVLAMGPHPFTSPAGPADVRIALRPHVPFSDAIQAAVHEYGHGLYEQGIPTRLWGTPAGRGVMPYLHESQAKFWENIIGRRRDFCQLMTTTVSEVLGGLPPGVAENDLFDDLAACQNSTIRTATDEVSFNLHIILRWEIEVALLEGAVTAVDVPALWSEKCLSYLGQEPRHDADGALQDPHWAGRYFGLFPCYLIGNILSAQMAEEYDPDGTRLTSAIAARDLGDPLGWLRQHVHQHGRLLTTQELIQSVAGHEMSAEPYRRHLLRRYR